MSTNFIYKLKKLFTSKTETHCIDALDTVKVTTKNIDAVSNISYFKFSSN